MNYPLLNLVGDFFLSEGIANFSIKKKHVSAIIWITLVPLTQHRLDIENKGMMINHESKATKGIYV